MANNYRSERPWCLAARGRKPTIALQEAARPGPLGLNSATGRSLVKPEALADAFPACAR
jgi:hypothetical protein